jgi:hypothetical protein
MMVSRIQPDVEMSRVGYELVTASQINKNFDPETNFGCTFGHMKMASKLAKICEIILAKNLRENE